MLRLASMLLRSLGKVPPSRREKPFRENACKRTSAVVEKVEAPILENPGQSLRKWFECQRANTALDCRERATVQVVHSKCAAAAVWGCQNQAGCRFLLWVPKKCGGTSQTLLLWKMFTVNAKVTIEIMACSSTIPRRSLLLLSKISSNYSRLRCCA